MKEKYNDTKNVYKDYIVLVLEDHKYYSYGDDKKILDYINFRNKLSVLKRCGISFVVIDDKEVIGTCNVKFYNNYFKYLSLSYMNDLLLRIKDEYSNC